MKHLLWALLWVWCFCIYGLVLIDFVKGDAERVSVIISLCFLLIILLDYIVDELAEFVRRPKVYQKTILTKPIFKTKKQSKAEKSRFQWKENESEDDKYYTLSLLGIINGILPKGWLLVLILDHKDNIIGRKFIKR